MNRRRVVARLLLVAAAAASAPVHADPGGDFDRLLTQGEEGLRANAADAALRAYERAAALRHDASAEWGLVRSWMQAGEYRRALAFSAHAAGAHADVAEGAGLYAWLLFIGGQPALAQKVLNDALQRRPAHPLLIATQQRLRDPAAEPDARLLEGATRQAPHTGTALPRDARAAGSGVLLATDAHALVPLDALAGAAALWLRDAQGRNLPARVAQRWPELGVAELALDAPLHESAPPLAVAPLPTAPRDAFAGSPGMAVEFAAAAGAAPTPAWPLLHTGFIGRWQAPGRSALGIELASGGAHGGPVFDRSGRLIGLALRTGDGAATLLASSALREAWPQWFAIATGDAAQMSPDAVYERAMTMVVQLIVVRDVLAMR